MRAGEAKAELPRLQRFGDRHQKAVVLAHIAFFVARRDIAANPAATMHVHAQRLRRADHKIGAIIPGRHHHAKADRVHAHDGFGPRRAGQRGNLCRPGFQRAQIGRVFEIHRRHVRP